jgi:fatty-acyl-CoA synthase
MLRALDEAAGAHDLSALKLISSSGLMWSHAAKQALLRHLPDITLIDILGASEASGLGYTVTRRGLETPTGRFIPGPKTVLITEDDQVLGPDSPGEGMIARSAPLPLGYHGDPAKTAAVFRKIGGVRYAIPGDWARRHPDGSLELIGRGSLVINTGGEKVFVEEVEEALKRVPGIDDALVVGLPDSQWGAVVAALVRCDAAAPFDVQTARALLRADLAGYKVPRLIYVVTEMPRTVSGKGDYRLARTLAASLRSEASADECNRKVGRGSETSVI